MIWEYEQALLDVVEAVSHQSGRPEPAVTIVEKVPILQKSLFNARILSAGWLMLAIFSGIGIVDWVNIALDGELFFPSIPLLLLAAALFFRHQYQTSAPPPANPIH